MFISSAKSPAMKFSMTSRTKSHKILFRIIARATPKLNMVNLQFARYSAVLASPTVSFEDLAT